MDDAKNFVLGIFQTVKERFGNPLVSAFVVAWAIWNFRLLLVLVGSGTGGWQAKITYIDTRLMVGWWTWPVHGLLIPLASALVWIYILPPVLRKVAASHERSQNTTREAIFTATEARTLSVEEALSMRQIMVKQRAEWQIEKAATAQSLENLVQQVDHANSALAKAKEMAEAMEHEAKDLRLQIEKLKAPPAPVPFNFDGQPTNEKAQALGLHLLGKPPLTNPQVVFDGLPVSWPWQAHDNCKINIPHLRLLAHPLDEETVWGMFQVQEAYPNGTTQSRAQWTAWLHATGAQRPEAVMKRLWMHGTFTGNVENPQFQDASPIRWLRQVGFKLA